MANEESKAELREKNSALLARFPAALKFILLLLGNFTIPTLFYFVFGNNPDGQNKTLNILATMCGMLFYFIILIRIFTKKSDRSLSEILRFYPKAVGAKTYGLLAVSGICLNLFQSALIALLPFPESLTADYASGTQSVMTTDSIWISLVYSAIFAPLLEEIFFRGFMYGTLRKGFSAWVSIAVTAVGFAVPHIQPIWIAITLVNGFYLAILRESYDNLVPAMTVHVSYNIASLPILLTNGTEVYDILFGNVVAQIIYLLVCGVGAFFAIRAVMVKAPKFPHIKALRRVK